MKNDYCGPRLGPKKIMRCKTVFGLFWRREKTRMKLGRVVENG